VTVNSTSQPFSTVLTGLTSNTTYYFETVFYDTDNNSYQYGAILSFKTQ
jgi:hypothetical protein